MRYEAEGLVTSTLKRTVTTAGFSLLQLSALGFIPGLLSRGFYPGAFIPGLLFRALPMHEEPQIMRYEAEGLVTSTLKRTVTTAGFSLLQLSALGFIPGLLSRGFYPGAFIPGLLTCVTRR